MNFSGEDRKEVFFFFEEILRSYKEPVFCENLRGHVSKASVNVRKYVLTKCRGDNFLEYFKRRKNYFNIEDGKISLKEEFGNEQVGNSHSNKSKKKNSKGKYVRRSTSFSHPSYASAVRGMYSNKDGEKEYETIAITYFRNRLIRKKKERLWAIEFNDLPKKVKRYLQLYYRNKVKSFLSDYPDKFVIDSDDESVSLAYVSESTDTTDSSSADKASSANYDQNSANSDVDSEIKKASEYLECVVFFTDILKKLNQPFPLEKLGGYFSQARKEIKDHVKMHYRSFKFFFDDAPSIFLKNASEEISLSKEYRKLIKAAENLIKGAKNGSTLPPEMTLKSHIIHIFQPRISSRRSSSILEETVGNNEVLSLEDMENANGIIEEMLEVPCRNRGESEMSHESTDDFFNNYLMRSRSRESSISLSSRSTRSISVERSQVEDCSVVKNMEKLGSNTVQGFNEKEILENAFLRCIFTVELFCLEFVESELNFIQSHENKAVEYFMEILDPSSTKLWRLSSLQGSIGNNREIAHFMNKLYKGEKFVSFFEKHPQFEVDPPFVKVALFDKENYTQDSASFSEKKNVMKDLKDLYELNDFKILLKETYAFLYDVCKFCENKDDVKVDRLSGILPRFPSCLNMIKSLNEQSLAEKIEHFLRETMLFQFPKKGSVFFPYTTFCKNCEILFAWFEKMDCYDPSLEFVSFSDFWTINVFSRSASNNNRRSGNKNINLEECYQNVVDLIEEEIESRSELSYNELPTVIPENVLFSLTNGNFYSRPLISAVLESGNFRMKNGKISLQKASEITEGIPSVPSANEDNEPTENISEYENQIPEKSSGELYVQQNLSDNNLVSNSFSPSVNSNDMSNLSNESEAEFCSNESSKILETTEYSETKETDSKSVEFECNLSFKDDKISVNLSSISRDESENFDSMNENHISETLKESIVEEESARFMNVLNKEENPSDMAVTDPESFNPTEETVVCAKTSKSVLGVKTLDLIGKESESVDESSNKCYESEGEVNSETDSLHNSDELNNLPLFPPEFSDSDECPEENQSLSSMSDSTNLLTSKDLSEFVNNQIIPAYDLNLKTDYIASLKEKDNISVPSEIKSLDKRSLNQHNTELEVASKNGVEANIKASEMDQNISFISEEENPSKFGIDLFNEQNSNDSVDARTETMKGQQPDDSELPIKNAIMRVYRQCTDKSTNLDDCEASELKEEFFQNDAPQVFDFNEEKGLTRIPVSVPDSKKIQDSEELLVKNKQASLSTKHSFKYTPEELFDSSLMKLYLSPEKVSDGRNPKYDVESEEKNAALEVPFGSSSSLLNSPFDETSKVNISNRTSSCNDLSSEYPMQPITAKVVLLTNSSCMALTEIKKCKKSIYFLKYAFTCEHQEDCLECFSSLQIGDEVSCFVPLTEISEKVWIAFLVTKDNSDNVSEFGIVDKLKENAKALCEFSTKSLNISSQIKSFGHHIGCQTEFLKCDIYSQTDLNDDIDLYKATKEKSCQTRSASVKSVFVQTESQTMTCLIQTGSRNGDVPLSREYAKSQTYLNGDLKRDVMSEYATSQEREITQTRNVSCQTFSTGQIMMYKHHPM